MTRFIRLTNVERNDIYIALDKIVQFQAYYSGGSLIWTVEQAQEQRVLETPEEIRDAIAYGEWSGCNNES